MNNYFSKFKVSTRKVRINSAAWLMFLLAFTFIGCKEVDYFVRLIIPDAPIFIGIFFFSCYFFFSLGYNSISYVYKFTFFSFFGLCFGTGISFMFYSDLFNFFIDPVLSKRRFNWYNEFRVDPDSYRGSIDDEDEDEDKYAFLYKDEDEDEDEYEVIAGTQDSSYWVDSIFLAMDDTVEFFNQKYIDFYTFFLEEGAEYSYDFPEFFVNHFNLVAVNSCFLPLVAYLVTFIFFRLVCMCIFFYILDPFYKLFNFSTKFKFNKVIFQFIYILFGLFFFLKIFFIFVLFCSKLIIFAFVFFFGCIQIFIDALSFYTPSNFNLKAFDTNRTRRLKFWFDRIILFIVVDIPFISDMILGVHGLLDENGRNTILIITALTSVYIYFINGYAVFYLGKFASYCFDTTFDVGLQDGEYLYPHRRTYPLQLYDKYLSLTQSWLPKHVWHPRLIYRPLSNYVVFEDERDPFLWRIRYLWMFIIKLYRYRAWVSSSVRRAYLKARMYQHTRFGRYHLRYANEELKWRHSLFFYYWSGTDLVSNTATGYYTIPRFFKPATDYWFNRLRNSADENEFIDESDGSMIPYIDDQFVDDYKFAFYYHNYRAIKHFDWLNASTKHFFISVPDDVDSSYYATQWHAKAARVSSGKAVTDRPTFRRYTEFRNRALVPYVENRSTFNYFKSLSHIHFDCGGAYKDFSGIDFIFSVPDSSFFLYDYLISGMPNSESSLKEFWVNPIPDQFKVIHKPASDSLSRFTAEFDKILAEFILENLFNEFCFTYGISNINISFKSEKLDILPEFYSVTPNINVEFPMSKFIWFVLSTDKLDQIYTIFTNGIFFSEFYYYFNKSLAFSYSVFEDYKYFLVKFYCFSIYNAYFSAISYNYTVVASALLPFGVVSDINFGVFSNDYWINIGNFRTKFSKPKITGVPYSRPINFEFEQFLGCGTFDEISDVKDAPKELDPIDRDEPDVPEASFELLEELYATDYDFVCNNSMLKERISCDCNEFDFLYEFIASFTSSFVTEHFRAVKVEFDSVDFSSSFFNNYTPAKLEVDISSKRIGTYLTFPATSFESLPVFDGFSLTDNYFINALPGVDEAYSDQSVSTTFEEYYKYIFFSDYRNFYSINSVVADRFYFNRPIEDSKYYNLWFRRSRPSPIYFSTEVNRDSVAMHGRYGALAHEFWFINYPYIFSSFYKFQFGFRQRHEVTHKFTIKSNVSYNRVICFFVLQMYNYLLKFIRTYNYKYFFNFIFQFVRMFVFICAYLVPKFINIFCLFIIKLFFRFIQNFYVYLYKFYVGCGKQVWAFKRFLLSLWRYKLSDVTDLQFYFDSESEYNFDFNDRVFFFLDEIVFLHFTARRTNSVFSIFEYTNSFFFKYFKGFLCWLVRFKKVLSFTKWYIYIYLFL